MGREKWLELGAVALFVASWVIDLAYNIMALTVQVGGPEPPSFLLSFSFFLFILAVIIWKISRAEKKGHKTD
ncbi:MAG: hypothetical protein JHC26_08630 [Thermofilum sp.]|jgi:hypothetical protein|uniref:hypothetical protein n=1 Tax=Thermofilum sp. TaxID=1961369 RepID=UPI00258B9B22|nr:hypothetical protein [Thermofilum sp.]MCI4409142.1 hypothetical protein [Thermofilum sp.]